MTTELFYKPKDGVAADFIPFFFNGEFHLFYLKDYRSPNEHGEGTPWFHLVTRDFIHFEDWGEALPRGASNEQDLYVFTGSVVEGSHGSPSPGFYIFYTGHNPHYQSLGKPVQGVMRAYSPDLVNWQKDPEFLFLAPTQAGYESDDWRDPFVFWNPETQEYWMLLAGRKKYGPPRHRGLTALAVSPDLTHWEVRPPLWAPDMYFTHECPDLFQLGDWWYLVYSTFSERCVTHYRMSRSLEGPWLAPPNDTFDGRAFYAAKTASDGEKRIIFGWLPTRTNERDDGEWNWGGNLIVHQLTQALDGTLSVQPPEAIQAYFSQELFVQATPVLGEWQVSPGSAACQSQERFSAILLQEPPEECLIEAELLLAPGTPSAGLLLRAASNLESYYQLRLEPFNQRLVIDRWPRPGDQPFMLERPLAMLPGQPVHLSVFLSGSCLVVYADHKEALSCRLYDHPTGALGLFVTEGQAVFKYTLKVDDVTIVNPI
jgi:beta-fructofuranosidase